MRQLGSQTGPVPATADRHVSGNGLSGGKGKPPRSAACPPEASVFRNFHPPAPYGNTPARALCIAHGGSWVGKGSGVGVPAGPEGTALTLSEGRLQRRQEARSGRW